MSTTEPVAWAGQDRMGSMASYKSRWRLRQTVSLYESIVGGFPKATLYSGFVFRCGCTGLAMELVDSMNDFNF